MKIHNNNQSESEEPMQLDVFRRMIDALMDEEIDPDLKAQMQRYVKANADEKNLEEAFCRYADKLTPYEGRLEGETLASYNNLAVKLGLNQASENTSAASPKKDSSHRLRLLVLYGRVAAVLLPALAIVGVWLLMNRNPADKEFRIASAGYDQEVLLPDSTHVSVEAGSSVIYHETENSRDVTLSGNAFFKVKRNESKPFHVSSGALKLTVLGTEFAVSEAAGMVSLFKGSVSVETGNVVNTLSWGDRLTFDRATGLPQISVIPASEMIAKGYKPRLKFNRATLGEILQALGAYYEVEIEAGPTLDLSKGALTVDFDGDALDEALGLLVKMDRPRMRYSIEGNKVIITK